MTITEVSKKYGLSADTLRYYERIGLIPEIYRNKRGVRDFTEEDCRWVEFIKCMRGAGLSIESLIEYVKLFKQGNSTINARKEILIEQRNQLADRIKEMQSTLDKLDKKIDAYEEKILVKEEELKSSKG